MSRDTGRHTPRDDNKKKWLTSEALFSSDEQKLEILGNPVMERWEKPFMRRLAEIATMNGGRVLEVGFGLGIASSCIQNQSISEHVVIEANQDVYQRLCEFGSKSTQPVVPLLGLWEDVIDTLDDESFDGILYDTYPLTESELHTHQFAFMQSVKRLLTSDGVLTYCNLTSWGNLKHEHNDNTQLFEQTQRPYIRDAGFLDAKFETVEVHPPNDCGYYQFNTAIAPIIRNS